MNDTVLYLDCSAGISGDMLAAALLDLGVSKTGLIKTLESLPLEGYEIEISEVKKSEIKALDFDVKLHDHPNHDHDMEYLHGPMSEEQQTTSQEGSEDTENEHEHTHHRNLIDVLKILSAGELSARTMDLTTNMFRILAQAESAVHNQPLSAVHFHEVGAIDSIVDLVTIAYCIEQLHPDQIIIPRLCEGYGQVRCQHGVLSIPVPAVTKVAEAHKLPLQFIDVNGELVTPTGAAAAACLITGTQMPSGYHLVKTGIGAGKRSYNTSGILRAMWMEKNTDNPYDQFDNGKNSRIPKQDRVLQLETNLDDCSGEALSYTMNMLFEKGALDVWFTPIQMKKSRPAVILSLLCKPEQRRTMEQILFHTTSTIGVRCFPANRTLLPRRILAIETPWGMADLKCCYNNDETYFYPENDSISRLAKTYKVSFARMYSQVKDYAERQWERGLIS